MSMDPELREMTLFLAREEQCETAWTHISECRRCQMILGIYMIGSMGDSTTDEDLMVARRLLDRLVTPKELAKFMKDSSKTEED